MATASSSTPTENPDQNNDELAHARDPLWPYIPRHIPRNTPTTSPRKLHLKRSRGDQLQSIQAIPFQRRPQCTHTSVVRIRGDSPCQICCKVPSNGWLYVCQQDREPEHKCSHINPDAVPEIPDGTDCFESRARIAEYLQMSVSVTTGIRARNYTIDQVERLLEQRRTVIRTIQKTERMQAQDFAIESNDPNQTSNPIASIGGITGRPAEIFGPRAPEDQSQKDRETGEASATTSKDATLKNSQPACTFQVCHTCRPMFSDRLYASFESVLYDEVPGLTSEEMGRMHLLDKDVVSTIGLRESPGPSLPYFYWSETFGFVDRLAEDTDEEISVDWTPTNSSESEKVDGVTDEQVHRSYPQYGSYRFSGSLSGLAIDMDPVTTSNVPCDNIVADMTIEPATTKNPHDPTHQEFIDSTNTTPISSKVSSISLPTRTTTPLTAAFSDDEPFELTLAQRFRSARKVKSTSCLIDNNTDREPGFRRQSSGSSLGSEMEVKGGVALTKEAVEMGVPDVITGDGQVKR